MRSISQSRYTCVYSVSICNKGLSNCHLIEISGDEHPPTERPLLTCFRFPGCEYPSGIITLAALPGLCLERRCVPLTQG